MLVKKIKRQGKSVRVIVYYAILVCMSLLSESFINAWGFDTLAHTQEYARMIVDKKGKERLEPEEVKRIISQLVTRRENSGFSGRSIVKITPYPDTQFIIWGPLKGAFKSLVRDLTYLHQHNIIDEHFRIIKPQTYFVFNGDVINGSEHILEAFMLILTLMNANSKRVFFIKGDNEDHLNWQNTSTMGTSLKNALQARVKKVSNEKIPLGRLVKRFFDTLPLALYITGSQPQEGLIRISFYPADSKEIDENACIDTLTSSYVNVPQMCKLSQAKSLRYRQGKSEELSRATPLLKAIIKAENQVISYKQHQGLKAAEPDRGATAWSIFSGPTSYYQENYNFFYDAFSILTTGHTLADATITLINRDVRGSDPFVKRVTYNLLTGKVIEKMQQQEKQKKDLAQLTTDQMSSELKKLITKVDALLDKVDIDLRRITENGRLIKGTDNAS